MPITDADREAANALRVALADISGFWHAPGDDSPLCQALAQHREAAEARLAARLAMTLSKPAASEEFDFGRPRAAPALRRRRPSPAAAHLAD